MIYGHLFIFPKDNLTKKRLQAGKLAFGFGVRYSRTIETARIAALLRYHWLFIDLEHSSLDLDIVSQISIAALDAGVTPIVRVPGHERSHVQRVLDGGAMGIWSPHIDTVEQAKRFVDACLYPPRGSRGSAASIPVLNYHNLDAAAANVAVNERLLVIAQLESMQAISNLEAIAAIDGIDVLSIGTSDLTNDMGIPNQFEHPDVLDAYRRCAEAAAANGKFCRFGGVYDPAFQRRQVEMGSRMPVGGADLSFMISGARQRMKDLSALESLVAR